MADIGTVSEAASEPGHGDLRSPLRALSVQQPWAWAIAAGKKLVENRTWPPPRHHVGLLAIHASKKPDPDALADRNSPLAKAVAWHTRLWTPPEYVYGAVIAVAVLDDCHHADECMTPALSMPSGGRAGCSPWAARGQWHWELAGMRPLAEPVPCRGALGLWRLPEEVERAVREQLEVPGD